MEKSDKELAEMALEMTTKSYSPYSRFKVGAALEGSNGVYLGTNVENKSYGLTVCAERVAVFNAIVNGDHSFKKIAVATNVKGLRIPPCGACLQVLSEFCDDLKIILVSGEGKIKRSSLKKLYPKPFTLRE